MAQTRNRTPRETPPGTKPKARQVSPEHLDERRDFLERSARLQQIANDIQGQLLEVQGEYKYWRRTIIDPRYGMTEADVIDDAGKIIRGAALNGSG